jgi:hypothetical protein
VKREEVDVGATSANANFRRTCLTTVTASSEQPSSHDTMATIVDVARQ